MEYVKSYRKLEVYKLSRELSLRIFDITESFPKEEMYSLTDQIRRSSRSVGGQIADAWAKRKYPKHFVSKLTDADGEQQESQYWIEIAVDCSYVTRETALELLQKFATIGKMLNSMIIKSDKFCSSKF